MSRSIMRLYYYEEQGNGGEMDWTLTCNILAAMKGKNFRTATMEDVEHNGPLGSFYNNNVLHVDDGFFEWDNTYETWECVDDIKDVLLDWMEYRGMQDDNVYETIISMKDYQVHAELDRGLAIV
jgi:hypothetical protein